MILCHVRIKSLRICTEQHSITDYLGNMMSSPSWGASKQRLQDLPVGAECTEHWILDGPWLPTFVLDKGPT